MLKTILTASAAAVALLASNVHAQSDTPGEGRAASSKPATKQEKAAARKQRQATSKEIAQGAGSTSTDNRTTTGPSVKKATASEKSAAKTKRRAEGAEAAKTGSAGGEAKQ